MKLFNALLSFVLSVSLIFVGSIRTSALGVGRDFYADDAAGIISESDRERIKNINEALFAMTGAELVVVTVDTTNGENIFSLAKGILTSEQIGSAERSNGMVLLISKSENNYWFLPDSGAADVLDTESVKSLCKSVLEPAMATADYSSGIVMFVSAVAAELEKAYGVSLSSWNGEPGKFTRKTADNEPYSEKSTGELFTVLLYIALVVLAVIIIAIVILIIRAQVSENKKRVIKKRRRRKDSTALSFAKGIGRFYRRR